VPISFEADVCGQPAWNQSAVGVVEESPELRAAHLLARHLFLGVSQDDPVVWSKPIAKPHLSLAYGNEPSLLSTLDVPKSFVAVDLALVRCDPPTLEGVAGWVEVARVSLA